MRCRTGPTALAAPLGGDQGSEAAVCGAGAARTLTKLGFTKVFNLEGGVNAWIKDNLPLTKTASGGKAGAK